jgi:signal transduction histidine kinase
MRRMPASDALATLADRLLGSARGTDPGDEITAQLGEALAAAQEGERREADLARRLAERTAELEAFTHSVSHDLRAPLRYMHGYLEMFTASARSKLDGEDVRYLDTIARATQQMSELIGGLLALSRVGKGDLEPSPVNLAALCNQVIAELEPETAGRAIEWSVGALPIVQGDRVLLRQALSNLLANAVKFTRGNAVAHIDIAGAPGATLCVRDDGVGFDMRYADKLFAPFQRLHSATEYPGTGIGLAIVQRVVARHGGRVWAEAAPGQGATFFVQL